MTKPTTVILLLNLMLAISVALGVCNGLQLHRTENAIEATTRELDAYRAQNEADRDLYVGCVRFVATLSQLSEIDACIAGGAR